MVVRSLDSQYSKRKQGVSKIVLSPEILWNIHGNDSDTPRGALSLDFRKTVFLRTLCINQLGPPERGPISTNLKNAVMKINVIYTNAHLSKSASNQIASKMMDAISHNSNTN